jgi:hypothetical protein
MYAISVLVDRVTSDKAHSMILSFPLLLLLFTTTIGAEAFGTTFFKKSAGLLVP